MGRRVGFSPCSGIFCCRSGSHRLHCLSTLSPSSCCHVFSLNGPCCLHALRISLPSFCCHLSSFSGSRVSSSLILTYSLLLLVSSGADSLTLLIRSALLALCLASSSWVTLKLINSTASKSTYVLLIRVDIKFLMYSVCSVGELAVTAEESLAISSKGGLLTALLDLSNIISSTSSESSIRNDI